MKNLANIFLISLLLTTTAANAVEQSQSEEKIDVLVGLGPYIQTQPYTNADPVITPSPVIFFDNRLFYVRWVRFGMYVYGKQNWGISITAQPRPFGYAAKDSSSLSDMEERKNSWEAGMAIAGKNDLGFAELAYFHDVLDNSNGSLLRLELGKKITLGRWTHVPSFYVIRFSNAFNNYYYGVGQRERTTARPAYTAKAAVNYAAQEFLFYKLNKQWLISANLRADYLASTITQSPIVDDQWMVSGMVSLMYEFQY